MTGTGCNARGGIAVALAAACLIAACSRSSTGPSAAPTHRSVPTPTVRASVPDTITPAPTSPRAAPKPEPVAGPQLPRGGRAILGRYRVVAYYGGPSGPALGVLGTGTPDQMAAQIERRAQDFGGYGLPLLPAMELIATVAQGAPGRDGRYSKAIPTAAIARYLDAARRHHMLLILDFQPGRGDFLSQVQRVAPFLTDPSVSVALDPEWKMARGQVPGRVIGSADGASINAVSRYLAGVIARHHLPDKVLLVHQFRRAMLPDRGRIASARGIELVLHADGFGTQAAKRATWHKLELPGRPFGIGVKLFFKQDIEMMTAAQAMALRPRPDVITYQ